MDNWLNADEMINEYKQSLNDLLQEKEKVTDTADLILISGMVSDLEFAIQWLSTAREPGTRRTISNRSRYQRTALVDDIERLSYLVNIEQENQREATEDEIERITAMLNNLSDKERAAYLAVKGQNYSFGQAAEILGVSKSTVQSYVNRAQEKIDNQVRFGSQNFLFDFLPYENHQ